MGRSVSDEEIEGRIKSDALRLISRRARSVTETRRHLEKKRYPTDAIERVIELLSRQGLLDDTKYALLRARAVMQSKPTGRRALERELRSKGLSDEAVGRAMSETKDYDEAAAAYEAALPRARRMAALPPRKARARLYGFLMRRGFSAEAVYEALDRIMKGGTGTDE